MARKRKAVSMPEAEPKNRPVRLELSQSDHDRLRMAAARHRISMAAYTRMVLMRAIDEEDARE